MFRIFKFINKLEKKKNKFIKTTQSMVKDHHQFNKQPVNSFTINGYVVINNFLSKSECSRIASLANNYLRKDSYIVNNDECYLICKKDIKDRAVDQSVQQIFNAQSIDHKLNDLFNSGKLEKILEERIKQKVVLQSITIQVDHLDTDTKRGYHCDGVTPVSYKAFIYLNDVNKYGEGPYTVIPGSHKHLLKRLANYTCSFLLNSKGKGKHKLDNRLLFYTDKQAISIFAEAGTLILSNQQSSHKGWHQHDEKERYCLIAFLSLKENAQGKFRLWEKEVDFKNI